MTSEPDGLEVLETALLVLSRVEPQMATALWLNVVDEYTLEEIAKRLKCTERTVRRWLDGEPPRGSQHGAGLLGGKSILRRIVTLFEGAVACNSFQALVYAFHWASGTNPWGTPFTAALLERLCAAQEQQKLEAVMARMKTAYQERQFVGYIQDLLFEPMSGFHS